MKKISAIFLFFLILACSFFSCKKDNSTTFDNGYNYFPQKPGWYVTYNVDSFYYDGAKIDIHTHIAKIDTFKFQLKEKIQSIYIDNQNRPTVRLERYARYFNDTIQYNMLPWILKDVWAENVTATTAQKVEENIRYIKLSFPVKADQIWNGNAENIYAPLNYKYQFFDLPRSIGYFKFDSVLQVTQIDDGFLNKVGHQYYIEKYARNIGLVYKQTIDIESQYPQEWGNSSYLHGQDSITRFLSKPIMNRVTGGFKYTMTVNSFGTEP